MNFTKQAAINRLGNILRFAGGLFGGGNAMDDVEWTPYDNIQNVSSYALSLFITLMKLLFIYLFI